jgi:hypothetical protein
MIVDLVVTVKHLNVLGLNLSPEVSSENWNVYKLIKMAA